MNNKTWTDNDNFINTHLVKEPSTFSDATAAIRETNLPQMEVSPAQGKFLYLLAKMAGASRILELGTFYGYSTMWLAKAVPDNGTVVSIELTPKFVTIARQNIDSAGLSSRVQLIQGDALLVLQNMVANRTAPFDMIFFDAHKPSYPEYLQLCRQLARPGTVLCGDNIILDGELANESNQNPKAANMREYIKALGGDVSLESTALQTVGIKGYDGFTISIMN